MSKTRLRFITIISLATLFVLTLSLAIGALPMRKAASAANYAPSSIFSAVNKANVGKSEVADGETSWIEFTFTTSEDGVSYRRDLALKWFEAAGEEAAAASNRANPAEAKYFSMTFAFEEIKFESFDIAFQSAEENITKDGQTTNTLHFVYKDSQLSVSVRDAYFNADEDVDNETKLTYTAGQDITVSFAELDESEADRAGQFTVTLTIGEEAYELDTFKNVGGYFMEYRSIAATTPQTPMTFTATLPVDAEAQKVLMKSLNGQTFEVGANGVADNAKPVLVLSEAVYSFRLGQRFSLTYEAIDVCDDSVSVTRSYYMLTRDEDGFYKKPSETTSNDYKTLTTSTFFMPTSDEQGDEAYVSIRFKLDDGTHSNYYVYLTWYAADDSVVETLADESFTSRYVCSVCATEYTQEEYDALTDEEGCTHTTGEGDKAVKCTGKKEDIKLATSNAFDYIVVNREAKGPQFIGVEADKENKTNVVSAAAQEAAEAYQKLVNEAAANVSAGNGAYIYLPSLRNLISSEFADYRNLRFSVYYFKPGASAGSTATSATSLRYNNLRFEVDEEGDYRFRVIAQDASSNAMKYIDEDGELVTVTSSNVWDIEGIPEFSFYIEYDGPSIEEAGSQDEGYRDTKYTVSNFKIIALDGYKTEYSLYFLDVELLEAELKREPSYSEFVASIPSYSEIVENIEAWAERFQAMDADRLAENPNAVKIFREINKFNADYTEEEVPDNAYAWNPDSSLSFLPKLKGTYFVKVDVVDSRLVNVTTHAYQAIYIRNPQDGYSAPSQWLQNNITAIVLFSISAVLLVAIVALFVVKPSDKTVEEVDLETLKGKKGKKKE